MTRTNESCEAVRTRRCPRNLPLGPVLGAGADAVASLDAGAPVRAAAESAREAGGGAERATGPSEEGAELSGEDVSAIGVAAVSVLSGVPVSALAVTGWATGAGDWPAEADEAISDSVALLAAATLTVDPEFDCRAEEECVGRGCAVAGSLASAVEAVG